VSLLPVVAGVLLVLWHRLQLALLSPVAVMAAALQSEDIVAPERPQHLQT